LGYRARIEEIYGWLKTVGGQRKTRYRGEELVGWMFQLSLAVRWAHSSLALQFPQSSRERELAKKITPQQIATKDKRS